MISIVVPVYNGEKYIEDCLKSILFQTYTDWELLLIDNASTDNSLQMCRDYAVRDERVQVLHQHHNMGVSVARNLGIEKARGEFITFIDIDDWIEPDYLEKMYSVQKKKNADMIICEYYKAFDKDRELLKDSQQKKPTVISKKDIEEERQEKKKFQLKVYESKEYLDKYFLKGNTHCWGVLFERELLDGIYFPKGITIGEDMLFLLAIAQKAKTIVVTNYKGYYYYINEDGAMKKKFTPSYMDQIVCWEKALKIIEANYPELITKTESIIVVSILLVVGKLSELSKEERKQYAVEEAACYQAFQKYAQKKEIRKFLPKGYPLKTLIYSNFPKGYIWLYGKIK